MIANAGPAAAPPPTEARAPVLLYLGRIHEKKNIGALIEAWTALDHSGELPAAARLVTTVCSFFSISGLLWAMHPG